MKKISVLALSLIISIQALAFDKVVIVDSFACVNKELFEKLNQMRENGDKAVTDALLNSMMTGLCTIFKKGDTISVSDITITGLVKARPSGSMTEYWTAREFSKQTNKLKYYVL